MEIDSKRMRISPAQLGALPVQNAPNCWVLTAPARQEMTIACMDAEDEIFTATTRIAKLLSEEQSYQLAAALMLNREQDDLNGGAVTYDVDDDTFLYCKKIDARMLNLSAFDNQINDAFSTAHLLRERLLHAQRSIRPTPRGESVSTSDSRRASWVG